MDHTEEDDSDQWAQLALENRRLAEEMGFDTKKWPALDWLKPTKPQKDESNEIPRETQ